MKYIYEKFAPKETAAIKELKDLISKDKWDKVENIILDIKDEWIEVIRILVLMGVSIEKSIVAIPDIHKFAIEIGMSPNEAAKLVGKTVNTFKVYFENEN